MTPTLEKRTRCRVADLPSYIPVVPVLENEESFDALSEAQIFLESLSKAVHTQNWEAFGDLFCDKCFWRDTLTLTFDKRTLSDRESIVRAWKSLATTRKPTICLTKQDFDLQIVPSLDRLHPQLASLDVPFSFSTEAPKTENVGIAKLIPEKGRWKIWVLSTSVMSLTEHPFLPLPRTTPSLIPDSQRGMSKAQGLPKVQGVLDAIVIGASCSGIANTIMLDSIGVNVLAFETQPTAGGNWSSNGKEYVTLHHNALMISLPGFPVPTEGFPRYLSGPHFTRYMSSAVESLKLPVFCGIKVLGNSWDDRHQVWHVKVQEIESKKVSVYQTKNVVLSTGFLISPENPRFPTMAERHMFQGTVEHSSQYRTAEPHQGKDMVVVGSGNSAHDVARSLAMGNTKSVTMLQRSPTVLFTHEVISPIFEMRYQGELPVDTADFLQTALPTGIARDLTRGLVPMLMQAQDDFVSRLENKGYMVNKDMCIVTSSFEDRGRSFYMDQQKTFDLVFEDRIVLAQGEARQFTKDGIVAFDNARSQELVLKADGVVFATGYEDVDLPKRYAESGFLDSQSAAMIENVSMVGVDTEGEMPGYFTSSGRKSYILSLNPEAS
jgi:putative flavoprotein involved in K+ transport